MSVGARVRPWRLVRGVVEAAEVYPSAGTRIGRKAESVRSALGEKVDLQDGIDRHQFVILRGDIPKESCFLNGAALQLC